MKRAAQIGHTLTEGGRAPAEPGAGVCAATTPDQTVLETTLAAMPGDIAAAGLNPPALLVVGRAVEMRQVLDWQGMMAGIAPRDLDPLGRGRPAEVA